MMSAALGLSFVSTSNSRLDENAWLSSLGFRFDPFAYWEASADPHLSEYTIGHHLFGVAWEEAPALIFAPAGGGKTTMRIYTIRTCWSGWAGPQIFPISLAPADVEDANANTDDEANFLALNRAAAKALLIGLAYHPERFLEITPAEQRVLAGFLQSYLPRPLDHYLAILQDTGSASVLARNLDRSFMLPEESALSWRSQFIETLATASAYAALPTVASEEQQFEWLSSFLLGSLAFRAVFILVDSLDARPEKQSAETALAWFAALLEHTAAWTQKRVYLKGFVPLEAAASLTKRAAVLLPSLRQARLMWTPDLLAEVIRRRVYVASRGVFGSLDAVATLDIRDLETTLARAATPLPREVVVLAQRVLRECHMRTSDHAGRIQLGDVNAALAWYRLRQWKPDKEMLN